MRFPLEAFGSNSGKRFQLFCDTLPSFIFHEVVTAAVSFASLLRFLLLFDERKQANGSMRLHFAKIYE